MRRLVLLLPLLVGCFWKRPPEQVWCRWEWVNLYTSDKLNDSLVMVPASTVLRFKKDTVQVYQFQCSRFPGNWDGQALVVP